jgi:hypothetical protein
VGGIKKENDLWFLDLCARGIQDRPHLGRFMKKYVDGGGHAQMARGCLPLKNGYGEEKIKSNLESLLSKLPKVPH